MCIVYSSLPPGETDARHTRLAYTCICVYVYVCMCMCMRVYVFVYVHVCIYICICVYVCVCVCVCVCVVCVHSMFVVAPWGDGRETHKIIDDSAQLDGQGQG